MTKIHEVSNQDALMLEIQSRLRGRIEGLDVAVVSGGPSSVIPRIYVSGSGRKVSGPVPVRAFDRIIPKQDLIKMWADRWIQAHYEELF